MTIWGPRKPIERPPEDAAHTLRRTLGWPHLIALGVGAIVGTGILVLTGTGAGLAVEGSDGPGAEVGEEFDHLGGGSDVEVGEGFVKEEECGVGLEDAGEGCALAHALRVLGDGAIEGGI